ncbi:MAG: hypothetical protein IPP66_15700 [Anaerolineales bacterium]|nr:hypothetical protein [Anaerolineales bacterium]
MNTYNHPTQRKEVTALDADVPLLRSSLIRFNVSELRYSQNPSGRPYARHLFLLSAA